MNAASRVVQPRTRHRLIQLTCSLLNHRTAKL